LGTNDTEDMNTRILTISDSIHIYSQNLI